MNRAERRAGKSSSAPAASPMAQSAFAEALRHHKAGRWADAERCYRQALQLDPQHAESLHMLGLLAQQFGQIGSAADLFTMAIARDGRNPDYHINLGNIRQEQGRFAEAEACYLQALKLQPSAANGHYNLGNTLLAQGRLGDALVSFQRAVRHRPDFAEAHNNIGRLLQSRGDAKEALAAYRLALRYRPDMAEAVCNLGTLAREAGQFADAVRYLRQALVLWPSLGEAHKALAATLVDMTRAEEAIPSVIHAVACRPADPEAHNNFAYVLRELGHLQASASAFEHALRLRPDFPEAHFGRLSLSLQVGDYSRWWDRYEYLWNMKGGAQIPMRGEPSQWWHGEPGNGRRLLIWSEQGAGDYMQFIRFIPAAVERGWQVFVEAHPDLERLFRSLPYPGITIVTPKTAGDDYDAYCPLMTLPRILGVTLPTLPAEVPYFSADPALVEQWRERLAGHGRKLKVGVTWRANPLQRRNRPRSSTPEFFARFLDLPDLLVVNLQKNATAAETALLCPSERLFDAAPMLTDFAETAAVMANLDLVISIDTSVCHLAGGLAVPAWTLIDFAPDWRWLMQRTDSPWYPTMTLFRQPRPGDWGAVGEQVQVALQQKLAGG